MLLFLTLGIKFLLSNSFGYDEAAAITDSNISNALEANEKGKEMFRKGNYSEAEQFASHALKLAQEEGDDSELSIAFSIMANISTVKGEYFKALNYEKEALKIAIKLRNISDVIVAQNAIGNLYRLLGDFEKALYFHINALAWANHYGVKNELVGALVNIGNIHYFSNNLEKAIGFYEKSLEYLPELNTPAMELAIQLNIGNIFLSLKDYKQAGEKYQQAIKLNQQVDNKGYLADCYNNLGLVYHETNRPDSAIKYFQQALEIKKDINDKVGIINASINLGSVFAVQGKWRNAEQLLNESRDMSHEVMSKYHIALSYKELSKFDSLRGDFRSSLDNFKKYYAYQDSMLNEEKQKAILDLDIKYETKLKDENIKILEGENRIKKAELAKERFISAVVLLFSGFIVVLIVIGFVYTRKARKNEYERKTLELENKLMKAQIKPHFIFNVLNSINNIVKKNDISAASDYLVLFARYMRKVLNSSVQDNITLQEEIESLREYLDLMQLEMKRRFQFEIKVEDDLETDNILVIPLLYQPFVENAIIHGIASVASGGFISVHFTKESDDLVCIISDNGVGMNASANNEKYSNKEHHSMGLKLAQERISYLKQGKDKLKAIAFRDLNPGTELKVVIPLAERF